MSKYCSSCGAKNTLDSKYCVSCGEKLEEIINVNEVNNNYPEYNLNLGMSNTAANNPAINNRVKKGMSTAAIIMLAIGIPLAIMLISGVAFFAYRMGKDTSKDGIAVNTPAVQKQGDTSQGSQGNNSQGNQGSGSQSNNTNNPSQTQNGNGGSQEKLQGNSNGNVTVRKYGDYILPGSDSRLLSDSEVMELEIWQLVLARNEIFARHGYSFNNPQLQNYFSNKSWYHKNPSYGGNITNDYEQKNTDLIRRIEDEKKKLKAAAYTPLTAAQAMSKLCSTMNLTVKNQVDLDNYQPTEIYGEKFYVFSLTIFYDYEGDQCYMVSQSTGKVYSLDVLGQMALYTK